MLLQKVLTAKTAYMNFKIYKTNVEVTPHILHSTITHEKISAIYSIRKCIQSRKC